MNVSVEVSKPKPVSLSNLSSKQSFQKQDPKIPTKQNVNELKNALAMALNKDKGQNKSLENKPVNANDNLKPIPKIGESKDGQKEVPEQVLKDVLKM